MDRGVVDGSKASGVDVRRNGDQSWQQSHRMLLHLRRVYFVVDEGRQGQVIVPCGTQEAVTWLDRSVAYLAKQAIKGTGHESHSTRLGRDIPSGHTMCFNH
eukprot:3209294-Pyramimonas_sp.AAC.1